LSIEATAMDYETFVTTVSELARTDRAGSERAIRATLQTLAEHVTREEARQVAGLLPVELGPWLHTGSWGAQRFDVDEFVRRIGGRAQVDLSTAQRYATAVFTALSQAVPEEYDNIVAQLPRDFTPLLSRGADIEAVPAAPFLSRVADRTGLNPDGARRATEAVLQTLAERIAGGEVRDLMMWLPVELHDPLKRGAAQSNGAAQKIPLDRFVRRVAEREGVDLDQAVAHIRAVFTTLREVIPDEELRDITDQLPTEYDALLLGRSTYS
jgi:uncharacterized protein (DUF2267 family)